MAILTGGTIFTDTLDIKLERVTADLLGSRGSITITKENTIVLNGEGSKDSNQAHCEQIRSIISDRPPPTSINLNYRKAGDGTTATVLAGAIYSEGVKNVAAGCNSMDLRPASTLDQAAVDNVIQFLSAQTKTITTARDMSNLKLTAVLGGCPCLKWRVCVFRLLV